jgi:curved DNA-binding protein CbpA
VADRITWYDILGVLPGASVEALQFAYQAKARQLQGYRLAAAPPDVARAAARGQKAVDAAWLVLGDRAQRERYDEQIGIIRRGAGLASPEPAASQTRSDVLEIAANVLYAAGDDLDLGPAGGPRRAGRPASGDARPAASCRSQACDRAGRPWPVLPGLPGRSHDGWLSRPRSPPDGESDAGRRPGCRPIARAWPDSPALQYIDRPGMASAPHSFARTIRPRKQRPPSLGTIKSDTIAGPIQCRNLTHDWPERHRCASSLAASWVISYSFGIMTDTGGRRNE